MRIAISTLGDNLDAPISPELGSCAHLIVVDTGPMSYSVLSLPMTGTSHEASRAAARLLAEQGVTAVIAGRADPHCAQLLSGLGIDLVEGWGGLTVRQGVEQFAGQTLYRSEAPAAQAMIAVASDGDNLDAPVGTGLGLCTRFLLVDPDSLEYSVVAVTPKAHDEDLSVEAIKTVVRGGAGLVITPHVQPRCCRVLFQMGVDVALCPRDVTVRQALDAFKAGTLPNAL
jgi:predicted Fe-Mo cluster-binding NifX family protein